jgi:uncharacterized ion transporter superfamily protein YfcC
MHKLGSRQSWIIPILMFVFAMGGSLFGMAEETLPLYVILIPIVLAAGYDTVTAVAIILLGSIVGNIGSTINPFSTLIASNVSNISLFDGFSRRVVILVLGVIIGVIYTMRYAKKIKAHPAKSLVADLSASIHLEFEHHVMFSGLNLRDWLVLGNFGLTFIIMVWGVSAQNWWMEQMSALVIVQSITTAWLHGMSEENLVNNFLNGAKELLGVSLILGLANGIIVLMNNAGLTSTFLHWSETLLHNAHRLSFIYAIFVILAILSIFIPSSSALAILAMPILVPLASFSRVPSDLVVTTYQAANGIVNLINPVSAVTVGSLIIAKVPFSAWLRFCWPLVVLLTIMILVCLSF